MADLSISIPEALRLNEADANDLDHIFESADLKNDQLKNQPGDAELTEGARIQQDTGESSEVPSEADSKLALLSDRIRRTTTVQAVRDRTKSFKKSLKESMRKRLDRVAVKLDQVSVKLDQVAGKLDRVAGKLERVGRPLRVFKTKVVMKFDRLDGDISMKLREEWAAFEASLRPEGSPLHQVWLVPCTTNHGGSYISYDPELILFRGSTQLPWEQHNFISTANTATRHSCFNSDGSYVPSRIEHYVEFAVVNSFDLHARKGTTWRQKFPRLYNLIDVAVSSGSGDALAMREALPAPQDPVQGGYIFEYGTDPWVSTNDLLRPKNWAFREAYSIKRAMDELRD